MDEGLNFGTSKENVTKTARSPVKQPLIKAGLVSEVSINAYMKGIKDMLCIAGNAWNALSVQCIERC